MVAVPLDYAAPGSGSLSLPVRRIAATSATRLGVLFVDPGGPGAGSLGRGDWFNGSGLQGYDVVGWDPRGVAAPAVACLDASRMDAYLGVDRSPDDPSERKVLVAADGGFADACAAGTASGLLAHLATADAARDLDLVRAALGEERLAFYGSSYSTLLGLWYARLFPGRVARMVLDSPVSPEPDAIPQVSGGEASLHAFTDWWAGEPGNPWQGDGSAVFAGLASWLRGLDASPIPVGGRSLDQTGATFGLWLGLYSGRAGWPGLAEALTAARSGDGAALLALADAASGRRPGGGYEPIAAAGPAIRCADASTPFGAKDLPGPGDLTRRLQDADADWSRARQAAPLLGTLAGPDYTCAQWPVRPAGTPTPGEPGAVSGVSALVVATTRDPGTPYAWAAGAVRALPGAVLLTNEGDGHVAYGRGGCVDAAVRAFLNDGSLPASSTCRG